MAVVALWVAVVAAAAAPPVRHATLPAVSPDGRHVVFVRELPDHSSDVYVVGVDGSNQRLVAHVQNGGAPRWTATGDVLLDVRSGDTTSLRAVPLAGGEPRTIVSLRATGIALSHDGRRVVYAQGGWTRCRMFVADVDGSNPRALTDSTFGYFNLAWSPDDSTIAVTRRDTTGELQIWTFDVQTGRSRALTSFDKSAGRPQWPAWSPDGRRIAVQAGLYDRDHPENSEADIWVFDASGAHARCITARDRPWMDETPSWVDNRRIAFQSTRTGRFEVWVMNADGRAARQVTR